ncbi:break repair meiotic recombinase recruitment factor 1 [Erethizon dorsatum]
MPAHAQHTWPHPVQLSAVGDSAYSRHPHPFISVSNPGIHPPKPPKKPRPGDSNGDFRSSKLGSLRHPTESEDSLTPAAPTEPSRQEPGPAVSSFPEEETIAASFLGQLEKEAALLPPSQTSHGKFVPQFAKPRKIVTRKAETREEDLERRVVSPQQHRALLGAVQVPVEVRSVEALPNSSAPWLLEGSLGPGDQMSADGPHSQQSGQKPGTPVPGERTGPSNSEMASQDPVSEHGTSTLDGGDAGSSGPESARPGSPARQLPCSGAEGTKPDQGAPQEGGAQHGTPEGGGGIPSTPVPTPTLATLCMKTWASAQDLPDPRQTPRGAGRQAECSWGGPACAPLDTAVTENMSTDAPETDQGALAVARPGVQANVWPPASPREQIPQGCVSLSEETTGGKGEAGPEDKPPSDTPGSPAAFQTVVPGNREPTPDAQDPGHPAPDIGPGVNQTQVPGPAVEWPGKAQLGDRQAAESGSQHLEGGHVRLSLALFALHPLEHRAATNGPFWEAGAHQRSLEAPTTPPGPLQHPPDSVAQTGWPESLAMDLDFLPDSLLQDALDVPDLEAPPEQDGPTGNESGLCCSDPSPGDSQGDRVLVADAQPRMEDASDTVRGLIVELSNLNRLIMSAHRDLEAFKRLGSRKARPSPCLAKGAGAVSWGEQPWRDL